jgi:DNA-binding response OmpR family regulator
MFKKILIVDDEADFCMIMKNYFIKKGYSVSLSINAPGRHIQTGRAAPGYFIFG